MKVTSYFDESFKTGKCLKFFFLVVKILYVSMFYAKYNSTLTSRIKTYCYLHADYC